MSEYIGTGTPTHPNQQKKEGDNSKKEHNYAATIVPFHINRNQHYKSRFAYGFEFAENRLPQSH
jgi:hypothetical protein